MAAVKNRVPVIAYGRRADLRYKIRETEKGSHFDLEKRRTEG